MATYTRKNVYDIDGGKIKDNNTLYWYARGVRELNKRKLDDPLSWRFYAGIHGFNSALWSGYGYLRAGEKQLATKGLYWDQCQHRTWYFLPWHRGYLLGIEATLRDAIVTQGGPSTWAMPYWNYFAAGQNRLPEAFADPEADLGHPDPRNPLFIEQRWGPDLEKPRDVYVPMDGSVNLDALSEPDFTGHSDGGSPGFGGPDTGFNHGGGSQPFGKMEANPHNLVHNAVGGEHDFDEGLMADTSTAALDPIFWLHHANIDRLWEVWRKSSHANPTQANWLNGPVPPPAAPRSPKFVMPMPTGDWTFTPGDVANLSKLGYTYDHLELAGVSPVVLEQLERASAPFARTALARGDAMAASRNVELVGASRTGLRIVGVAPVAAPVELDGQVRRKLLRNVGAAASAAGPERVFLNLENVRGRRDSTILKVYVDLPQNADPAEHPERLAGTAALFGVREATTSEEHGGGGLTFVFEITHMVGALELDTNALDVRIVPGRPVPEEAEISVGRVSLFRQGS